MKNLKQTIQMIIIAVVAISFTFCGGSGTKQNIDEVKLIPVKVGEQFQYIDQDGKIVINPQFMDATIFRNGLALVQTSGNKPQWGFIGEDGKFVITPNYKRATVFSDDLAWVVSESAAPSCINTKGELKFTLQNAQQVKLFKEGLAAFKEVNKNNEEKWGFVDKDGKVKINPQFLEVGDFRDGKCPVCNNEKKWGYIDKDGKFIINPQFDFAEAFHNDKAVVISGGKAGLIDATGKYLINPQFSYMQNDGNLFLIEQDGKFGWSDKDGKIIINPQFSKAFPFTNGDLAAVQSGNNYGYIDKEGKIVINPQFDIALPFNGKLAVVVGSNKIGFIDNKGKYVINPQFDDVSKDLIEYYQTGGSEYSSVQTDYVKKENSTTVDSTSTATETNTTTSTTKSFSGSVGRMQTYYNLTWNNDKTISGTYFYSNIPNVKYTLKGNDLGNGKIKLTEFTGNKITANCDLALQGSCYLGQMNNTDGKVFKMTMCE